MTAIPLAADNVLPFQETPRPAKRKAAPRRKKATTTPSAQTQPPADNHLRISQILRNILDKNLGGSIPVQKIVDELGSDSFGASLMVFSLPELLPVHFPGLSAIVALPNGVISSQMIRGKKQIQLPNYFLKRSIPRKVFAAAVHTILPGLERLERAVKPNGPWVNHPIMKRFLGVFILTLAGVIALPIPWVCTVAASGTMAIGMGMVEKNTTLVVAGILLGLGAIAIVGVIAYGAYGALFLLPAAVA